MRYDKILTWSILKAKDKIIVNRKMIFAWGGVGNITEKIEKLLVISIFLFPQCFQKATFSGSLKVGVGRQRVLGCNRTGYLCFSIHLSLFEKKGSCVHFSSKTVLEYILRKNSWVELTLSQTTNLRLFKTERVCR